MFLQADPTTEPQAGTGAEQAAEPGNPVADGFNEFVSRIADGDYSLETWLHLWTSVGQKLVLAIVLIVAVLILAGWIGRLTASACRRAKTEETLTRFLARVAKYAVLIAGGVVILNTLGVGTAGLAALLAGAGFAIGMALSGTLGNVAAGVMLLFLRPFKVGDVVNAAGVLGKIDEIGLFSTVFDTFDNKRVFIPNKKLFEDNVETVTYHPKRRVDVPVGTGYEDDIDHVRRVLERVVADVEWRIAEPESQVYLDGFGDSSINWILRVWSTREDMWNMRQRLIRDVKAAFDQEGIGIPFPQRDLHVPGKISITLDKGEAASD